MTTKAKLFGPDFKEKEESEGEDDDDDEDEELELAYDADPVKLVHHLK